MKPFHLVPLDLLWKPQFRIPDTIRKETQANPGRIVSDKWEPGKVHIAPSIFTVKEEPTE